MRSAALLFLLVTFVQGTSIHRFRYRERKQQGRPSSFVSKFVHKNHRLDAPFGSRRPIICFSSFLICRYLEAYLDAYWSPVLSFSGSRPTGRPLLLSRQGPVRHGTITHVGTVQQSRDVTKSERYKNRDGT